MSPFLDNRTSTKTNEGKCTYKSGLVTVCLVCLWFQQSNLPITQVYIHFIRYRTLDKWWTTQKWDLNLFISKLFKNTNYTVKTLQDTCFMPLNNKTNMKISYSAFYFSCNNSIKGLIPIGPKCCLII